MEKLTYLIPKALYKSVKIEKKKDFCNSKMSSLNG